MKIRLGAMCKGMNEADTEDMDVDDDISEDELTEMAREHGLQVTGFEFWFKKLEESE